MEDGNRKYINLNQNLLETSQKKRKFAAFHAPNDLHISNSPICLWLQQLRQIVKEHGLPVEVHEGQ